MQVLFGSLFVLACFVTLATAEVPATGGIFCADVKESVTVNGTIQSTQQYNLCMNTALLQWKRTNMDGSWQMLVQVGTSGDQHLYNINVRGECTVSEPTTPADKSQLPWSFVTIDQDAHKDGTGNSPGSEVPSNIYYHDRKSSTSGGVTTPEEMMYWYVIPGTTRIEPGPIPDIMIETVCKQLYDVTPGDGGTSTTQYGNRDFSTDYSVTLPLMADTFTIPPNTVCTAVDTAMDAKYDDTFGPVLF